MSETEQEIKAVKAPKARAAKAPEPEVDSEDSRDSRDMETREVEARAPITYRPAALLPDPVPMPGWKLRWIRLSNGPVADTRHVAMKFHEGWVPVAPSEQPGIARSMPNGGQGTDRIVIGELMLCKISDEWVASRRAYYDQQAKGQLEGVTAQLMSKSDSRMPIMRPEIETRTKNRI